MCRSESDCIWAHRLTTGEQIGGKATFFALITFNAIFLVVEKLAEMRAFVAILRVFPKEINVHLN